VTLYKDKYTGKWVEGYPYMQWPTDKNGHHLMPDRIGFFGLRIHHYEYEYIVAGGCSFMPDTGFATECKEVDGHFIAPKREATE
jgi:hypothetical protein